MNSSEPAGSHHITCAVTLIAEPDLGKRYGVRKRALLTDDLDFGSRDPQIHPPKQKQGKIQGGFEFDLEIIEFCPKYANFAQNQGTNREFCGFYLSDY